MRQQNELINEYMAKNKCSRATAFRNLRRLEARGETIANNETIETKSETIRETIEKPVKSNYIPNWKREGYKNKADAIAEIVHQVAKVAGNSTLMLGTHKFDLNQLRKV